MGELLELVLDLHRQFACRDEHEGPRPAGAAGLGHLLEDREHEGGGLARPRAGLAEHVHAGEGPRNQPGLHRGWHGVARPLHGGERRRRQAEMLEALVGIASDRPGVGGANHALLLRRIR